jgi:arylsulfatase A-like enzyme
MKINNEYNNNSGQRKDDIPFCFLKNRGGFTLGLKSQTMSLVLMFASLGLAAEQKPNVIYILTDQWRSSAFGYAGDPVVKTPNIDKFSKEAVIFSNAVSVCPVCTPHRASLMTGRFPTSTGMFLNDLFLPETELCMAEIFKSAGYSTAYYGKWHLDGHGRFNFVQPDRRQGFDFWKANECDHDYNHEHYYENDDLQIKYWPKYSPFAMEEDVELYLDKLAERKNPFLLFVSFGTPHFPHQTAMDEYKKIYPTLELAFRKNVTEEKFPGIREELQGYYAHSTATDKAIGDLINKLKKLNLFDNSIIIFTSDHGEMMGSHGVRPKEKQLAWDESVKVPFLIHVPGLEMNGGKAIASPLTTPDILPTMLSLANIEIPKSIEGEDLSSMIRNPGKQKDRSALFMSVSPFATTPFTAYRGIKTIQYTYVKTPDKASALFDNATDPFQINNLIDRPEYQKLQQKMEKLLQKELKAIGDQNFKTGKYYFDKWGYDLKEGQSAPYNTIPGKISKVYTPQKKLNP